MTARAISSGAETRTRTASALGINSRSVSSAERLDGWPGAIAYGKETYACWAARECLDTIACIAAQSQQSHTAIISGGV